MNTRERPSYNKSRTKQTIDFVNIPDGSIVLDIGEKNKLLQSFKNLTIINTISDLDYKITPNINDCSIFKYVTCFEVIEHLLNPRMFFDNLYKITSSDVEIFLSYPSRPKWMWNNEEHFHEYDRMRFEYLLKKTGFKIIKEKKIFVRRFPSGIRPIIRNFIPQTIIYKLAKTPKINRPPG